jgi:hypothetical protein
MKHHTRHIFGLALLSLAITAQAQSAQRQAPLPAELPPYAKDKPLPAPKIVRHTLPNGLMVWLVPRQGLPRWTKRSPRCAPTVPTPPRCSV